MSTAILRAQLSDPERALSSIPDADLRLALEHLSDSRDDDNDLMGQLVLLAWSRNLLTIRLAPPAREPQPPSEFVRLMKEFSDAERERRLRLARAT